LSTLMKNTKLISSLIVHAHVNSKAYVRKLSPQMLARMKIC
jgi:hypothetical protein